MWKSYLIFMRQVLLTSFWFRSQVESNYFAGTLGAHRVGKVTLLRLGCDVTKYENRYDNTTKNSRIYLYHCSS